MLDRLYVVGHPVAHSKSPVMHNAAYRALGLDWHYDFKDCETADQAEAFFRACDWLAVNVTMPYKPLAASMASKRTDAALLAGGANVLINCGDGLFADNTDGKGCVAYLRRCGVNFEGARVVVCGSGPTSLAIMHACAVSGAERIALVGRSKEKCQQTIRVYSQRLGRPHEHALIEALAYGQQADEVIACADVVIDATSLGMTAGDPAPFDTQILSSGQTVFDVVYGHGVTALIAGAREAGCAAYDGAGMLVAQAVETVYDIAEATQAFAIAPSLDLFAIMADAAGFEL